MPPPRTLGTSPSTTTLERGRLLETYLFRQELAIPRVLDHRLSDDQPCDSELAGLAPLVAMWMQHGIGTSVGSTAPQRQQLSAHYRLRFDV